MALRTLFLTSCFLVSFLPGLGLAQVSATTPQTPSSVLGTQQLESQSGKSILEPSAAELPQVPVQPKPELAKPLEDVRVAVNQFSVQGVPDQYLPSIHKALVPFLGEQRSFEDLSNAATQVARVLQSEFGLYLAYAYLPAQQINGGTVIIQVLPGYLEEVVLQWPEGDFPVDREVVEAHLAALKPGQVIRVSEVERVVFLLNDLRGMRATFTIQPGEQTGTAKLLVSVAPDALLEGVASLDVNGSRFAGTNRVGLTVSANSPLGKGDSLTLSHLQTTTGGLDFTLLGYLLPVGADGFKAGVNVSQVNYNLSDADFPLGLEGDSDSISVFGLYPLVRSRNLNLFVLANHERKYFSDRLRLAATETRKVLTQNSFTLSGDFRDSLLGGAINTFELAYTDGEINYPQGRPAGLDDASLLRKTEWEYSRLQSLVPGRWLAYASLRGQAAGNNLDSSAQCTLGGSQAVRAFAQGEGSGDNCQIYTTELRYVLPWKVLNRSREGLYVAAFYDQGRVRLREDASARPTTFVNTQRLAGYGLALNWEVFDLLTWQISLGWPLEGEPASDPKKQEPRIYSVFRYYF